MNANMNGDTQRQAMPSMTIPKETDYVTGCEVSYEIWHPVSSLCGGVDFSFINMRFPIGLDD